MANLLFPNIDVYGPKELATDLYTRYQPNISETQFVTWVGPIFNAKGPMHGALAPWPMLMLIERMSSSELSLTKDS